ncbi:hypothetical protein JOM56_007254 [Amanita muscaria]
MDIPNVNRLVPRLSHSQHDLIEGKLLEPEGIIGDSTGGLSNVRVCQDCLAELEDSSKAGDKPPRYALANNLWIRRVPWQLQTLTFPEQMLIALLYPRVYVFKLYPKDLSFRPDSASLQRGLRGNVTTYELDVEGVASMIQGRLMPRPITVLSSVISITFIGRGALPRHCLRSVFRVRRFFVAQALQWLKEHNPKYYGDIDINSDRLGLLPDDDIPDEILSVVRQSSDVDIVDQEGAGYVPSEASNFKSGLSIFALAFHSFTSLSLVST